MAHLPKRYCVRWFICQNVYMNIKGSRDKRRLMLLKTRSPHYVFTLVFHLDVCSSSMEVFLNIIPWRLQVKILTVACKINVQNEKKNGTHSQEYVKDKHRCSLRRERYHESTNIYVIPYSEICYILMYFGYRF